MSEASWRKRWGPAPLKASPDADDESGIVSPAHWDRQIRQQLSLPSGHSLEASPDSHMSNHHLSRLKHTRPTFDPLRPTAQDLNLEATLGCIPYYTTGLALDDNTYQAISQFEADFSLPGILIHDHGAVVGVLSRQRFYEWMSRPFSLELFSHRSLRMLWNMMSPTGFVLDGGLPIATAARQALERPLKDLYEPIIVRLSQQQYGVIDIHTLLLAQNIIHELTQEELHRHKQALLEERDLAQMTLQAIADGVITTDALGYIQEINPIAEKLTQRHREEAIGLPIATVFKPMEESSQRLLPNPVETVLNTQQAVYSKQPTLLCHPDLCWDIQYSVSPIFGSHKKLVGAILVFRDVTQQQVLLRQIHWQASHDALTGLVNRREFEAILTAWVHQALAHPQAQTAILIYLDLDRFKAVNDTCGHFAGDELLRQVGDLLHQCLRQNDVLARLGGDEFGLFLPDCDPSTGQQVADRIYQTVQDFRFCWQDYLFTIGVSIGITTVTGDRTASDVLQQADGACYMAKHQGRNQICWAQQFGQNHPSQASLKVVHRLTEALTHSQFKLFYQKIFSAESADTSQLLGAEILLRLPRSPSEYFSPDTFLPTAERYNLMAEIDTWVVQKFCADYEAIQRQAQTHLFCLNLSGASLNSDRLSHAIRQQFEAKNIQPQSICIEITETIAIANLTRARALLQELKAWGCSLALDDFGAGISAFQYLRSLPVDYLKINGHLIRDAAHDRVAREMVSAIIRIGHEMGIKTVAEWVENATLLQLLNALGVDYVQGFFWHIPEALESP